MRQESHALSAARRKKADEFRKQRILENIEKKNGKYKAIKDGERTLKSMTEKMAEVMAKTRAEIRVRSIFPSMSHSVLSSSAKMETMKLNAKDKLTPDTIIETVKSHSEKVLFPR